jgi:Phage integrase family
VVAWCGCLPGWYPFLAAATPTSAWSATDREDDFRRTFRTLGAVSKATGNELHWDHVDFGDLTARPPVPASAAVWRSVRADGETKTEKSRRTLGLPQMAVDALRLHRERQEKEQHAAGVKWSEHGLVFAARTGGALDAANVRRDFKAACRAAKLGEQWTPRELRHSFVSLMSSSGVPVEEIARLAGHSNTRTTEVVYRRELRPVLTTGAEAMDRLFQPPATHLPNTQRHRKHSTDETRPGSQGQASA